MFAASPKKVLLNLGFEVSRTQPAARTRAASPSQSQGWLVELVGPSGVGKTTLREEVAPMLRQDWFFEQHAKGLMGETTEDEATALYIKQLLRGRLDRLQDSDLTLENIAAIGQRVFEVARLGLVSKSPDLPRGFLMDDGMAHFFAEQIMEQDRAATEDFMARTAFIFLLPDEAETHQIGTSPNRSSLDVYCALRDTILALGRPTLLLKRSERATNPEKMLNFIKQDVLGA
ncbi:MAG: hypothetical protein ABJL99_27145 [Aliishimia sp.]